MKNLVFLLLSFFANFAFTGELLCIPPDFGFAPPVAPYEKAYLKVSSLHEIYYELSGNPKGTPVFILHGGPGTGLSPSSRQLFDPKMFMVVLADQRGCGQSRPRSEIRENTTQDLIEDIEKLRLHLGLKKIMMLGGSWGSTLALAYAEAYPKNVSGLILRAVFLGSKEEIDFIYEPGGVERFFPEVFERIAKEIEPGAERISKTILEEHLISKDKETFEKYARLWSWYELKITNLNAPDDVVDRIIAGQFPSQDLARLETHYASNDFFLKEGQLLENADRLDKIPVIIVQGRYDMMTPPITAYRLYKKLPRSKLWIVEAAGHTDWEMPIAKKLAEAVANLHKER